MDPAKALKEERRRIMKLFRARHEPKLQSAFSQSDLLKLVGEKRLDGFCFAATLDWLRRNMWNCYAPLMARKKRGFDDPKYRASLANPAAKKQFARKQIGRQWELEDKVSGPSLKTVRTFVQVLEHAGAKMTGLHGLESTNVLSCTSPAGNGLEHVFPLEPPMTFEVCAKFEAYQWFVTRLEAALDALDSRMAQTFAPALGMLISINGDVEVGGHATMLYVDSSRYRFFDPNIGEYAFDRPDKVSFIHFFAELWFMAYHRFMKMDVLQFSVVEYGEFGIGGGGHTFRPDLERSNSLNPLIPPKSK